MLTDKLKNTLKRYSMLKSGSRILLCVSGGPDSVAMLFSFYSLAGELRLSLCACHLNHQLRGAESDRDEEYVKELAGRLKIPLIVDRRDVGNFASANKLSLEDAARRLRYDFFLKCAWHFKADAIATAHTKDDQAETILMRLLRGAGMRGMRGIVPSRDISGLKLIRPLIAVSRKEVEDHLRAKKIKPRYDTSNLKPEFFRNKIRLKLLPLLEKEYSPNIKELLANLADVVEKDYEYIEAMQLKAFKKAAKQTSGRVVMDLGRVKACHISLRRAFIRLAIASLKGNLDRIDYRHWQEIESLIDERKTGSVVHLPGGISVTKKMRELEFEIGKKASFSCHSEAEAAARPKNLKADSSLPAVAQNDRVLLCHSRLAVELNVPGVTSFGRRKISARILNRADFKPAASKSIEHFDLDSIQLPLYARRKAPGDRMMPLGMAKYKKLSDMLIDEKIPVSRRENIPVIAAADNEVLWLCGVRMSDRFKVTNDTRRILRLEVK